MTAYQDLISRLSKRGNKLINNGSYAIVFELKQSNNVIKIGSTVSDPFLIYAQCKSLKGNKFFPKIKKLRIDPYRDYYVCVMERLYEGDEQAKRQFISDFRNNLLRCKDGKSITRTLNNLSRKSNYIELDMHYGNILTRSDGSFVIVDPLAENESDPHFEEWLEKEFYSSGEID